jgi:hypothetical protein
MDPMLKAFEPHLRGVYGAMNINLGGETMVKWSQLYPSYQVRQMSYDEMIAQFEPFYKEEGLKDFMEQQRDWRRGMQRNEQFLASIRARALAAKGDEATSAWVKYRALTKDRQIWAELGHSRQMKLIDQGPDTGAVGPYEYGPQVLAKIKERLKKEKKN